jgi:glyoxylate reductase
MPLFPNRQEAAMMRQSHVFITRRIPEEGVRLLQTACAVTVWDDDLPPPYEELLAQARECDGLLALLTDRIDAALLDACPHLRVVSNMAVGYDNIDIAAATARGILVGNTPDVLTATTADLAFALLLAAARRIPEGIAYVQEDSWDTWGPLLLLGQDVHHATLGIVGLGRIGQEMARRARGFAMRVLYTAPTRDLAAEEQCGVTHVSFAELLRQSDFISIHAPLTPATRGMFGAEAFAQMKPTAILINTARGQIVQTDALSAALRDGIIGGAALDVTDPEPLRADHPLVHLPNCIVVPHIGSASQQARGQMALLAAHNILAGLQGALPSGCVNPIAARTGRQAQPYDYEI